MHKGSSPVLTTDRYTLRRQTYETSGTLRIIVYGRLSKNRSGLSTNTSIQVTECLDEAQYYARQQGLKLVVVAIYEENDVSASKYSTKPRPDYLQILEYIKTNQVDAIFATEMERLCRRPREMEDIIDLSEVTDLRYIYFTSDDNYDLRTVNGISRARDAVNRADRESRKISERITRKLADRAREGGSHGGRRAYGYKPGGMELEDHEAEVIRQMGDLVLRGMSCREVAYWANEQGYPTAEGKLWPAVSVQNMLRRPRYVGIRVHKGAQYEATWPAVFTREKWDQIQLTLMLTADRYTGRSHGRRYLLTGLVYCGKCGMPLNGSKRTEKEGHRRTYGCRTEGTTQPRYGCGGINIGADGLEHWIAEAALYRLDTPDLEKLLNSDDEADAQLAGLLEERNAQQLLLDSLVRDYATRLLARDQFALAKTAAEAEVARIESAIDVLNRKRAGRGLVPVGQALRGAWDANKSDEWRRSLLALVIERITIHPSTKRPIYMMGEVPTRFDPDRVEVTWRA